MGSRKRTPPVPSEGSVELGGATVEYSKYVTRQTGQVATIVVEPANFPKCPICIDGDPTVPEHVPPESLGGRVMTKTCGACNHGFGTAEDHLRRFLDLEVTVHAETTDGSVQGRRAATVGLRSAQGPSYIAVIRTSAPEFRDVIDTGTHRQTVIPPDREFVIAATLKHAYLAACLHQGEIPKSEDTTRVRAVLLAARTRDRVGLRNALSAISYLSFPIWIEAENTYPILLLQGDGNVPWLFALGGRFMTPWPFPDVEPRAARAAGGREMSVGGGIL